MSESNTKHMNDLYWYIPVWLIFLSISWGVCELFGITNGIGDFIKSFIQWFTMWIFCVCVYFAIKGMCDND